jgi:zinc D-Ala-D-Ala carboxypeptidase
MMNLTENFTLEEMTFSPTAIRKGIANKPSQSDIENMKLLCEKVLEPLREYMECGISISSGYRAPALNLIIGGSKTSQHCFGQAADLKVGNRNSEMFDFIKDNLDFDQVIWEFGTDKEPDWVHVSYKKDKNRKQALKAVRINGKTQYQKV